MRYCGIWLPIAFISEFVRTLVPTRENLNGIGQPEQHCRDSFTIPFTLAPIAMAIAPPIPAQKSREESRPGERSKRLRTARFS